MRKYPVERYLVNAETSIHDALKRIEETERRTVYVVDAERRLLGSVTDGDIRRWQLGGGDFSASLREVINPRPIVVYEGFDHARLGEQLVDTGATCVPLIDDRQRVLGMVFWEDIVLDHASDPPVHQIDIPVVIMAGGPGTRMAPFTQVLPKPLLPVGEKTVIELILDRFVKHGVRKFLITLNYKATLLRAFFQDLPRSYEICFVEEERPLGTAGGLGLLADQLDSSFLLTNCDIIVQTDYHELVKRHEDQGNQVTMVVSDKKYHIPYGVCEIEQDDRLKSIAEKPEFNLIINTGMYVLSPEVLRHVDGKRFIQMNELIEVVRTSGGRVGVHRIGEGSWLDTGEWAEYRRTLQQFETRLLR